MLQTGYDAYEVTSRTAQVPSSETTEKGGTTYNNFDTDANFGINVSDAQVDDPAVFHRISPDFHRIFFHFIIRWLFGTSRLVITL